MHAYTGKKTMVKVEKKHYVIIYYLLTNTCIISKQLLNRKCLLLFRSECM